MSRDGDQGGRSEGKAWRDFVFLHGFRAHGTDLAFVLGRELHEIEQERMSRPCVKVEAGKSFQELFTLWHGRSPEDDEWPAPQIAGGGNYEWQAPEVALLATLVGQLGAEEIAAVLTERLRQKTGDASAERTKVSVVVRTNVIGMMSTDVVGGITIPSAAKEIGSLSVVQRAVSSGALKATRRGRLWVIPHAAWSAWKAARVLVPEGHVRLASIREQLGIKSDKLSEFARMGLVPGAVRTTPIGSAGPSTQFGTWFVPQETADKLLADRKSGLPMPWQGAPLADNLKKSFEKWRERLHPVSCTTCEGIWGTSGAPATYEEYERRYPPLQLGAKRHLTMKWCPGVSLQEVADQANVSLGSVRKAIKSGTLAAGSHEGVTYVTKTDLARWITRKCPTGESGKSWLSLETAAKQYGFSQEELRAFMDSGVLTSKVGDAGAMRGIVYVLRHQCGQLRETKGFSLDEAASRVGVSTAQMRALLEGVDWRQAGDIPLATVKAVSKRVKSSNGYSIAEAAKAIGKTEAWVQQRIADGTVKVARTKWEATRLYLSEPMFRRLSEAALVGYKQGVDKAEWLRLSEAAAHAGVTSATIRKWDGERRLTGKAFSDGWRYQKKSLKAAARVYWRSVRFYRAVPPAWLAAELEEARVRSQAEGEDAATAMDSVEEAMERA